MLKPLSTRRLRNLLKCSVHGRWVYAGSAADVLDISRRVEQQLCGGPGIDFSNYDHVIIAADDLAPSETLQLDTDKILGFVTSAGSTNSHTAITKRTSDITPSSARAHSSTTTSTT